jgi:hypothetical protein
MRDLVVREALVEMARDAAKRFRELVAAGEEIPYDVHESGDGSPIPQYVPLTERFVRDHASELRELDSFGSACAAIESAGLAGPYLEDNGIDAPPDPRRRAELAGIVFLARMWMDSTDFSLDDERLRASIAELEAHADAVEGEIEVVVPLRGLRMEATRVDLATASIVRADTVEVPAEARASEASGGAGWEPTFLAIASVPPATSDDAVADAGTRAVEAFRSMITALRLYKPGGVALGPHAWTRVSGGRWRRIATGAGRPRPGGYRLAETEIADVAAFSRGIHSRATGAGLDRPRNAPGLTRAIARFEAGLERTVAIDALNDYLLALRFLLEGGGPADLGLSMRVASLCATPDDRSSVKAVIDRAIALERELWSGEPPSSDTEGMTPAETALEVEELARAILKDGACGHLGADLRATADEILLADGLAVGEGAMAHRGETAEWSAGTDDVDDELDLLNQELPVAEEPVTTEEEVVPAGEEPEDVPGPRFAAVDAPDPDREPEPEPEQEPKADESFEWHTPTRDVPRYGREAPVVPPQPASDGEEVEVFAGPRRIRLERAEEEPPVTNAETTPERTLRHDDTGPVARLLALHSAEREATASRVANLFPAPETTEWNVREIAYDRSRRAPAGEAS